MTQSVNKNGFHTFNARISKEQSRSKCGAFFCFEGMMIMLVLKNKRHRIGIAKNTLPFGLYNLNSVISLYGDNRAFNAVQE